MLEAGWLEAGVCACGVWGCCCGRNNRQSQGRKQSARPVASVSSWESSARGAGKPWRKAPPVVVWREPGPADPPDDGRKVPVLPFSLNDVVRSAESASDTEVGGKNTEWREK